MQARDTEGLKKEYAEARVIVEQYVKKLVPVGCDSHPPMILATRLQLTSKLLVILNALAPHLPDKREINVASLKNAIPDDFMAMKIFYDLKYGPGNYRINYFTFYADDNDQAYTRVLYTNFPELHCITCDPTDKEAITAAMLKEKVCQQGFDLVLLRHTQFSPLAGGIYFKMLTEVIPFIAARNAKVLFTFFHDNERSVDLLRENLAKPYSPLRQNYFQLSFNNGVILNGGETADPDTFCTVLHCEGRAFDNKLNVKVSPLVKLSAFNTEKTQAHQALLIEMRRLNEQTKLLGKCSTKLLRALLEGKYNFALRLICADGLVEQARVLLKYQDVLKIDVNEASPKTGTTTLEWVKQAKVDSAKKEELIELLIQCGLQNKKTAPKIPA